MLEKPLACVVPIFPNSVADTAKLIHVGGTDHSFILHMKTQRYGGQILARAALLMKVSRSTEWTQDV